MKNGRLSYEQLRKQYDRVIIRHCNDKDGTGRTTCLLIREGTVFVGVAKFSNRTFTFSKKKGRVMAQGRAEHSVAVFDGKATVRVSKEKRREELSYIVKPSEHETVEDIIARYFENDVA